MRLTEKVFVNKSFFKYAPKLKEEELISLRDTNKTNTDDIIQKLGQLEDIEEELDVELTILFKALKNGIWLKEWSGQVCKRFVSIYNLNLNQTSETLHLCLITNDTNVLVLFEDYGKTWALTKEELL